MLKVLRNKELKRKVLWVVAVVIILSFGFFGQAYMLSSRGQDNYAGKIFGKKIEIQDFEDAYKIVQIQAIMRYGENFNKVRDFLNLENQTWDRLILLHEADRRKIKVFNDQVIQSIESKEFFQRNGQFDSIVYNEVLKFVFRIQPRAFEEGVRQDLQMALLYDQETKGVSVSPDEIQAAFKQLNEQVQVSYALVSPDEYKDEKMFDEAAARKFFEENKESFLIPSTVNVEYIEVPFAEKKKAATDEELLLEEKQHEENFKQAQAIYDELIANPDLAAAASARSLTVKQTGFFSSENPNLSLGWPLELLDQVFRMKPEEIQGPVETANGYVVLKIQQKRGAYVPEYEEVKGQVKDRYLREQAMDITQTKTAEFRVKIKEALDRSAVRDFSKTAKELGLNIQQTPSFNRGQYLPNIGINKNFETAAFALNEKDDLSDVVETPKGYCILHLDSFTPAVQDRLKEQEGQIKEKLMAERRNQAFSEYMTRVRLEANLENKLAQKAQSQAQ